MNFSEALVELKAGQRVRRVQWEFWIYLQGTEITHKIAPGQLVPWEASHADLLADDWLTF